MCGLGGVMGSHDFPTGLLNRLHHRGPDDAGAWRGGGVALVHTRLAIQDLDPRSRCPFTYGTTTIVYNGELWNAEAAKIMLGQRVWETTGDTEVVAAALNEWGPDALGRLEGMFVVAWMGDSPDHVYLARDRFGEIPVHWAPIGRVDRYDGATFAGGFAFASELKALRTVAPLERAMMLEPGHWLEFRRLSTGRWRAEKHRWYDAPTDPWDSDGDPTYQRTVAAANLRGAIERGCRERSVSDVPACTLLSGGIDSTAVAYHLRDHLTNLVAFTAVHDPKGADLKQARVAADMLGLELVEVRVPRPTRRDLEEVIRHIEMPYKAQVEIGWACLHLAREMEARGFKVTFSGEGSDELWASYGFAYHAMQRPDFDWNRYRKDLFVGQHQKNFARCNKVFMAHGVECRLPFLHTQLVELALSLPQHVVADRTAPKAIMSAAYDGLLPPSVVARAKLAFQDGIGLKKAIAADLGSPGAARSFYSHVYKEVYA